MMDEIYKSDISELVGSSFPPSYLVIKLRPNIHPSAVSWLVQKMTDRRQNGGAELLVRSEPFEGTKNEVSVKA